MVQENQDIETCFPPYNRTMSLYSFSKPNLAMLNLVVDSNRVLKSGGRWMYVNIIHIEEIASPLVAELGGLEWRI